MFHLSIESEALLSLQIQRTSKNNKQRILVLNLYSKNIMKLIISVIVIE